MLRIVSTYLKMQNVKVPVAGKIGQVYADGAIMQSSNSDAKIYLPNEVSLFVSSICCMLEPSSLQRDLGTSSFVNDSAQFQCRFHV